jgi:ubiquinone/menaquinone biosynthesis C-methylase UbiE
VLAEAARIRRSPSIELIRSDARRLPWPDGHFDVALCSLALHHFGWDDAVKVLAEMWRVARRAIVVVDLRRSLLVWLATWLVTRAVAPNHVTRHDGPLSVRRAYSAAELACLARSAGLSRPSIRRPDPFRVALVAHKAPSV